MFRSADTKVQAFNEGRVLVLFDAFKVRRGTYDRKGLPEEFGEISRKQVRQMEWTLEQVDTCETCDLFVKCPYKGHEKIGWCMENMEFAFSDDEICPCEIERRES